MGRPNFRNDMHPDWVARNTPECHGFDVTFEDGFKVHHVGGCATISHELIEEHGAVKKAEAF